MKAVAFTAAGAALCAGLCAQMDLHGYAPARHCQAHPALQPLAQPIGAWAGEGFAQGEDLIFIGAVGIAVRAIAPHVTTKERDVAVVALDELGQYVIPLLSGHIGGANALAVRIAQQIGGTPVLTTATDCNEVFAIDTWAAQHNCKIADISKIKHFSASLLAGEQGMLVSDFAVEGSPKGVRVLRMEECVSADVGAIITHDTRKAPFTHTLTLLPQTLFVGMGCRRGVSAERLESAFLEALAQRHLPVKAVKAVCSIDIKADEPGLLALCETYGIPFRTFCAERLSMVAQAQTSGSGSDFVRQTVGVDNVCERAALCGAGTSGELLLAKYAQNGVTVAIARENWRAIF